MSGQTHNDQAGLLRLVSQAPHFSDPGAALLHRSAEAHGGRGGGWSWEVPDNATEVAGDDDGGGACVWEGDSEKGKTAGSILLPAESGRSGVVTDEQLLVKATKRIRQELLVSWTTMGGAKPR